MAAEPRLADGREYPRFLSAQLDDALAGRMEPVNLFSFVATVRGALRALDPADTEAYGAYGEVLIDETHRRLERARFTQALPKLEAMLEACNG